MAVSIRLKRFGRTNRPTWRIAVMDKRSARDGESIEEIGTYDTITDQKKEKVTIKADRALFWMSKGAQPSKTVHQLFKRHGVYASATAAAPAAATAAGTAAGAKPAPAPKKK